MFFSIVYSVGTAVLKILTVIFFAGISIYRKILKEEHIHAIAVLLIKILLPCLIISNILQNFYPYKFKMWFILPIGAGFIFIVSFALAYILIPSSIYCKNTLRALSCLQNAGYFVIPLGQFLFRKQSDIFTLYVFLFILTASPLLWSIGYYLMGKKEKLSFYSFISPPFVANILSLLMVFTGIRKYIPFFLIDILKFLGTAAVPLALFVLGARISLTLINLPKIPHFSYIIRVFVIKMILTPLIVIIALKTLSINIPELMKIFFIIQASCPPAVGLIIQATERDGFVNEASYIMLITYLSTLLFLPLWLGVWNILK